MKDPNAIAAVLHRRPATPAETRSAGWTVRCLLAVAGVLLLGPASHALQGDHALDDETLSLGLPIRRLVDSASARPPAPIALGRDGFSTDLGRGDLDAWGQVLAEEVSTFLGVEPETIDVEEARVVGTGDASSRLVVIRLRQAVRLGSRLLPVEHGAVSFVLQAGVEDGARVLRVRGTWYPELRGSAVEPLPGPESALREMALGRLGATDDAIAGETSSIAFREGRWVERYLVHARSYPLPIEYTGADPARLLDDRLLAHGQVLGEVVLDGHWDNTVNPDDQLSIAPLPHVAVYEQSCMDTVRVHTDLNGEYAIGVPEGTLIQADFSLNSDEFRISVPFAYGPWGCSITMPAGSDVLVDRDGPGCFPGEFNVTGLSAFYHTSAALRWVDASGHYDDLLPDAGCGPAAAPSLDQVADFNMPCNAGYGWTTRDIRYGYSGRSGGTDCNNMVSPSVLAHELGHHLDRIRGNPYPDSMTTYALSEGWGDLVSSHYTGEPRVGLGYVEGDPLSFVRDVSQPHQYCELGDGICGNDKYRYGVTFAAFGWTLRSLLIDAMGVSAGGARALDLAFGAIALDPQSIPEAVDAIALVDSVSHGGEVRCAIATAADAHGIPHAIECATGVVGSGATRPVGLALSVSPNPASGAVSIRFELARREMVQVRVFDVSGRLVDEIQAAAMGPGSHEAKWSGTSAVGTPVPAGIYFIRVDGGTSVATRKLSIVH